MRSQRPVPGVIEAGSGLVALSLSPNPPPSTSVSPRLLLNGGLFRTRCASNAFFLFLFLRTIITGLLHSREAGEKKQERLAWCETLEARLLAFIFFYPFPSWLRVLARCLFAFHGCRSAVFTVR